MSFALTSVPLSLNYNLPNLTPQFAMSSSSPSLSPAAPPQPKYFLRTAPLPSTSSTKYGNLYLRHHSGGINAIMIMPLPPRFIKAHSSTNPARVLFTSASHPGRQWGLVLGRNVNARADKLGAWEEVLIVEGKGDEGLVWEASGDAPGGEELVWKRGERNEGQEVQEGEDVVGKGQWRGWMVCEWQYEHPQLFWVTDALKGELPDFCERVKIVREMLD